MDSGVGLEAQVRVLDECFPAGLSEEFEGDATSRVGGEPSSVRVAREMDVALDDREGQWTGLCSEVRGSVRFVVL